VKERANEIRGRENEEKEREWDRMEKGPFSYSQLGSGNRRELKGPLL
jgi:hypothetical protein